MTNPSSKKKKIALVAVVTILLLVILGAGLFLYDQKTAPITAIQEEQESNYEQIIPDKVPGDRITPAEEITDAVLPPAAEIPPQTETGEPLTVMPEKSPCQLAEENLNSFFEQLAAKDYIKAYELEDSIQDHLNKMTIRMLNNPPLIANETDNWFLVLKNGAHFYRILGPRDISLIKDILVYESEDIESILASFYDISPLGDECTEPPHRFQMPLKKLYEYAAFFLNTVGGQSYLFRRDSNLRTLIRYYATLVIARADQQGINNYAINLDRTIADSIREMEKNDYLIYKNRYLEHLSQLRPNRMQAYTRHY